MASQLTNSPNAPQKSGDGTQKRVTGRLSCCVHEGEAEVEQVGLDKVVFWHHSYSDSNRSIRQGQCE